MPYWAATFLCLGGVAGDEGDGFAELAGAEGGQDLIEREAAEADDGEADALIRSLEGAGGLFGAFGLDVVQRGEADVISGVRDLGGACRALRHG